jgi:hypothetical protein
MGYWIVDGKQMTEAEYREHQRHEVEARQRVQGEAAALVKKLGETYAALTGLMQQHPEVDREITDKTAVDEKIYEKLRQNLEQADKSPRCRWVRQDGTICGSPQLRKHIYCYAHKEMMEARALALRLPPPEDANAIQISVQRVQTALIDETISAKTAGLLLYSLQLAMTNVGRTTFGQADEMVTKVVDEEEALREKAVSTQQSAISQNKEPGLPLIHTDDTDSRSGDLVIGASGDQKSNTEAGLTADEGGLGAFTAKDAESAKEEKLEKGLPRINTDYTDRSDLPRIDADERGLEEEEEGSKVVTMRM